MPTIVHFEIPADDMERAKGFYTELFGWKIEQTPGPMDYWMIFTTDENGNPVLGGGMMRRQDPRQSALHYVCVPSVDEHAAKVERIGGKVVVPKRAVPGMGYFAVCLDTENNCFGLWETDAGAA
jgi:predicted enzyme related to lactoylglutathione lyase